jgi:8-oxo-dGTP pyrophosphatase MutT (NUDIX family)
VSPPARPELGDAGAAPGHLALTVASLEARRPGDEREVEARRRVLAFLGTAPRPFDQGAGPEHVTASAVVAGPRGTVLHVHKLLGIWLQPGGHVEAGEAPWEAARREAQEETGLTLAPPPGGPRLLHVDVHSGARGHVHLDLRYLLLGPDADPAPPAGESPDVRWFTWDEAMAVADDALLGALRSARRQPEVRAGRDNAAAPAQ